METDNPLLDSFNVLQLVAILAVLLGMSLLPYIIYILNAIIS